MSKVEFSDYLQSLFNENNYSKAIQFLNEIISSNSDSGLKNLAHHHLGRINYFNQEYKAARQNFIAALKINEKDFYSKIFLASILKEENKINSSIKLLENAYDSNENANHLLHTIKENAKSILHDDSEVEKIISTFNSVSIREDNVYPKISIIILCYNKVEFTEKCLTSLFANTDYPNFETIVVDNASVDDTPGLLESYGNRIKFVHSFQNQGFVGGNNQAVYFAEGEYLVFLNNDTEVQPYWLENLLSVFKNYKYAGAVGSKLLYPNGVLQEAGGVIFNDATGWNYGKNNNALDSKFSFVREVDYCSGAALMVRSDLFAKLNGFDTRYAPAYFEDTDLCFGIRKLGYKVYYSPFSKVIHFEGATSGTDLNSGFKKFQVINTPKFIDKWQHELSKQYSSNPEFYLQFTNRNKGKRILIIDDIPPLPDRAAGALRHYHTLTQMLNLGYNVTYVHLMGKQYSDESAAKYLNEFKMRGVEFIWFNYEQWWAIRETPQVTPVLQNLIHSLELKRRDFSLIYIAFWYIGDYFVDLIKKEVPNVPILLDTMDIHYLREERQAEMSNDAKLKNLAQSNKKKEIELYSKVDCVTTVTEDDRSELKKYLPNKSILILTDVHDPVETKTPFTDRKDFLFVGNFNHTPNKDAVIYFCEKIFPLIKKQLPDSKFYIVGNNPTPEVKSLASKDVVVTGWVPEILPYLEQCRVSVVPLRYGAGNKGKVGQTLSHGLPMVSTTIGAEGMNVINGQHSFVTDDPSEFAKYSVELYTNENLWNEMAVKGRNLISSMYSSERMRERLKYIMSFDSLAKFKGKMALSYPNPPKVSIILIAYNQYEYTQKCIDSILKHTKISCEIILVDNASTDGTAKNISKRYPEIRLIKNQKNLGFPIAVNQGIKESLGEFVLLLNNDTIVTENWLKRLVEVAESNKEIGLVGPISNEVSGFQRDNDANYKSIEDMHTYAANIGEANKEQILNFPRIAFLCTLIKQEVIKKIGGLDERFSPGNYEDDDFCLRAQLAGFKTVIAKDVFIHHFGSKSFKANGTTDYGNRLAINRDIFSNKWGVTPTEVWLENKTINQRQIYFPLEDKLCKQYFERAKINIADNELTLAEQNIKQSIDNFEDGCLEIPFDELLDLAGNICLANSNLNDAKQYFEKELNLVPNSSSACLGLGECLFATEEYEIAKTMFEWALNNNPDNQNAALSLIKTNNLLGLEETHNSLVESK